MDVIIFDGPSLLSDASAINLVALSDVVLLVIDAQTSRNPKVLEAQALLANIGAPFATVFNRARPGYLE
jgi:Mrp family chromosome partitioning ATPase